MVRFRIKRVVNRVADGSAQTLVVIDERRAPAVSKNKIVFRNERAKCISMVGFHPRQSCRSIHIPEGDPRIIGAALQNFLFQKFIEYAHAAVLDHQIASGGLFQQHGNFISVFINDGLYIAEITRVAVLQTVIGVGLCKYDSMAQRVKLFINPAIISRCAIPVGRRDAGPKDENLHREISWQICMSCCARWAQVWRSRMVCNPFSASWWRAFPSRRRCRSCSVISTPSRTTT